MARCASCPNDECIPALGFPCTVFYEDAPVIRGGSRLGKTRMRGATTRYFWHLNDPADLEAFGGNEHRRRHISSPVFRAACLARVKDRRSIGQRRWDELHPQQKADMLASAEAS